MYVKDMSCAGATSAPGRGTGDGGGGGGGGSGTGDGGRGGARGAHALHVAAGAASRAHHNGGAGVLRAQRPVPGRARRGLATNDPGSGPGPGHGPGQRRARARARARAGVGAGAGGRVAVAGAVARPARLHAGGADVHGRGGRVLLPGAAAQRGARLAHSRPVPSRSHSPALVRAFSLYYVDVPFRYCSLHQSPVTVSVRGRLAHTCL